MQRLTTSGIRPSERAEFWADLVSRHVTPIDIEPTGARMTGRIDARPVSGDLVSGVAYVSGRGIRAVHTRAHVERTDGHLYAACVHLEGETTITSRGVTTALRRGDIFCTDSRQPFTLGLEQPWRHLVLTLPCEILDQRVAVASGALAGMVVREAPLARLWGAHLAAGFAGADGLSPGELAVFSRHSVEMLAQLVDQAAFPSAPTRETPRSAVYLSACHIIATRYFEARLTPVVIARHVGVSSRTLARAFAERQQTVMQRLLAERVRRAAQRLRSPAWAHRSVTDVAFACGFADLSHFGRLFVTAMQMTPGRYRRSSDAALVP